MLDALQGRAKICLDLGHWHAFAHGVHKKNLTDWLTVSAPFLGHLHLHDNDGSADQHLGLGQGSIPWDILWTHLREKRVSATLEPHTVQDFRASWAYLDEHNLRDLF